MAWCNGLIWYAVNSSPLCLFLDNSVCCYLWTVSTCFCPCFMMSAGSHGFFFCFQLYVKVDPFSKMLERMQRENKTDSWAPAAKRSQQRLLKSPLAESCRGLEVTAGAKWKPSQGSIFLASEEPFNIPLCGTPSKDHNLPKAQSQRDSVYVTTLCHRRAIWLYLIDSTPPLRIM